MSLPSPKVCKQITQLHALMGSANANEAETARTKLRKLLDKHRLTWNDLPAILAEAAASPAAPSPPPSSASTSPRPSVNVLDLLLRLIEEYLAVTPEERMAIALWILHTYVYDRYTHTPRLVLLSPVRECGKTTALVLIELLAGDSDRSDNITAAAIYHTLYQRPGCTLLIDEGDNLGIFENNTLRSLFNGGYQRGGKIKRFIGGRPREFSTFAPLAIGAIGTLPQPLLSRSVIVHMQRYAPGEYQIRRLDEVHPDPAFAAAREEIRRWAATCVLNPDPDMPANFNRPADRWRVLLAIADNLGPAKMHAQQHRCNAGGFDDDPAVLLLIDIRSVFAALGVDRIKSEALVEALLKIEDSLWNEWRGPNDDRQPRKLTQGELAKLLKPFRIRPRTIWPANRRPDSKSARGYLRRDFEAAWRAYCSTADTPTHRRKIMRLAKG